METFKAGDRVEIVECGVWIGPFIVTDGVARTPDHLILSGPYGLFEHYNDAPFNTRKVA